MAITLIRVEKPLMGGPKTHFERVFNTYTPERQKEYLTEHLVQVHARIREIDKQIRSRAQKADLSQAEAELTVRTDEAAA